MIFVSTVAGVIPPKSLRVGKLVRDTEITPSVSDTADTYWPATAVSALSNFPIAVVIFVSTVAGVIPPKSLRVGFAGNVALMFNPAIVANVTSLPQDNSEVPSVLCINALLIPFTWTGTPFEK